MGQVKHDMSKTSEWNIWVNMKQRCDNPKQPRYIDYGGRGISVCDKWQTSFENFLEDMGKRPEGMTLDRIDNDKGYYPENCRWATYQQQNLNKRLYKSNSTGYAGIAWHKPSQQYRVQLKRDGIVKHIGYFKNLADAIIVNNKVRSEV